VVWGCAALGCGEWVGVARQPDLVRAYAAVVTDLDARPITLTVPGRGLRDDRFVLTGREFEFFVEDLSADAAKVALLPELIAAARWRDTTALAAMVGEQTARMDEQQLFGRAAVHCRDKKRYHQRRRDYDRGYILQQLPDVCTSWAPLGPVRRIPRNTPVPFLMLVGELDPGTPSENAFLAQERLGTNAHVMTFPAGSHVVGAYGCTRAITEAFFRDPRAPVREACGGRLRKVMK
jgi:pimeloyl-ACP methyl ester carboxylesterase